MNKAVTIALGTAATLFSVSLVLRCVLISAYGIPGDWVYLGLPIGGISVVALLLRIGRAGA
jgi:TRAP-type C4-dicarboxylate transport system permease small subunit